MGTAWKKQDRKGIEINAKNGFVAIIPDIVKPGIVVRVNAYSMKIAQELAI